MEHNIKLEASIVANSQDMEQMIEYQDHSVVSKTLIQKTTGTITLFAFDEGEALSEHTAPFDAFVQILDGESEISIGGNKHNLIKGNCIIMPANIPHAVNATKKFKMLLVMIR